jgi:hypothetical protein
MKAPPEKVYRRRLAREGPRQRLEKACWQRSGRRRSPDEGPTEEGSLAKALRTRLQDEGLVQRIHEEGSMEKALRRRLQHARGESEATARVCEKMSKGGESSSCPHVFGHYIGKQKFTGDPLMGVGFTCHSNGASWASSMGLGPYECGLSQHLSMLWIV